MLLFSSFLPVFTIYIWSKWEHFVKCFNWGQLVFVTNDVAYGWDGKLNGNPQETGAYIYHCRYSKNNIIKEIKGTVILIR